MSEIKCSESYYPGDNAFRFINVNQLTKREQFALVIYQTLISRPEAGGTYFGSTVTAVKIADALIAELEKSEK